MSAYGQRWVARKEILISHGSKLDGRKSNPCVIACH